VPQTQQNQYGLQPWGFPLLRQLTLGSKEYLSGQVSAGIKVSVAQAVGKQHKTSIVSMLHASDSVFIPESEFPKSEAI